MTKITVPNIFSYATKELSQDAFLCWLFSFSEAKYSNGDFSGLNKLAIEILQLFSETSYLDIKSIKIEKQKFGIDIWIEINNQTLIIIENKTASVAGKNQLDKYYNNAKVKWLTDSSKRLKAVYFKTGLESKNNFERSFKSSVWTHVNIENLISIMSNYNAEIDHPFFVDYFCYWYKKVEKYRSFTSLITQNNLNEHDNDIIEAFYKKLETDEIISDWQFANGRGSKQYYANSYKYYNEASERIYLQLDRFKLKIKFDLALMDDAKGNAYKKFKKRLRTYDVRDIYNRYYDIFSSSKLLDKVVAKPKKYSCHNFLTFAIIPADKWMVFNSNNELDYEKTKINIKNIQTDVDKIKKESKKIISDIYENKITGRKSTEII